MHNGYESWSKLFMTSHDMESSCSGVLHSCLGIQFMDNFYGSHFPNSYIVRYIFNRWLLQRWGCIERVNCMLMQFEIAKMRSVDFELYVPRKGLGPKIEAIGRSFESHLSCQRSTQADLFEERYKFWLEALESGRNLSLSLCDDYNREPAVNKRSSMLKIVAWDNARRARTMPSSFSEYLFKRHPSIQWWQGRLNLVPEADHPGELLCGLILFRTTV